MKDHEAFWLIDGKAEAPKRTAVLTDPAYPRFGRFTTTFVDDSDPDVGLCVSECRDCEWRSRPASQHVLFELRMEHAQTHREAS